jgi:hypothetical protein
LAIVVAKRDMESWAPLSRLPQADDDIQSTLRRYPLRLCPNASFLRRPFIFPILSSRAMLARHLFYPDQT